MAKAKKGNAGARGGDCQEISDTLKRIRAKGGRRYTDAERVEILECIRDSSLDSWQAISESGPGEYKGILTMRDSYRDACEELAKLTGGVDKKAAVEIYFNGIDVAELDFGPKQ